MIKAVPLGNQLLQLPALLVGIKIKFLIGVDKAVAGQGQIGLNSGFRHGLGGGTRIVVEVRYGGDAEAQALRDGQQRRGPGAAGIHLVLLLKQGLQGLFAGQVVGKAPQHGGGQMGVTVDETGHGYHTGAFDDGLWQFLRDLFGDELNFAIGDADVHAEEDFRSGSHGYGGYVGDQCIQNILPFKETGTARDKPTAGLDEKQGEFDCQWSAPSCSSSRKTSRFCSSTVSNCSMYCSGNFGLWNRVRRPPGRLILVMPPPPRERMLCSSSIM